MQDAAPSARLLVVDDDPINRRLLAMTPTRSPRRAAMTATLAVVLDLPVPPRKE